VRQRLKLELPGAVLADGLDGPVELVAERLGEELLDRDIKLVREDDRETRIDVVLRVTVSNIASQRGEAENSQS
jgi:hypothetical protein